jgi:hypothetical protein
MTRTRSTAPVADAVSLSEYAARTGQMPWAVYQKIVQGELAGFRARGRWYINPAPQGASQEG